MNPNQTKQENYELMFTYLSGTSFYQQLRNKYSCLSLLSKFQQKCLVQSGQIYRIHNQKDKDFVFSTTQQKIFIIIHGQLEYNRNTYIKGQWFYSHQPITPKIYSKQNSRYQSSTITQNPEIENNQHQVTLKVYKKTALLTLSKKHFQSCLNKFQKSYQTLKILTTLLVINKSDQLGTSKNFLKFLSTKIQIKQCTQSGTMIVGNPTKKTNTIQNFKKQLENLERPRTDTLTQKQPPRIFFLISGIYTVLCSDDLPIGQLQKTYYGEEILWNDSYDFKLKLYSSHGVYGFINKSDFLENAEEHYIEKLKNLYNIKKNRRLTAAQSIKDIKQTMLEKQRQSKRCKIPQNWSNLKELIADSLSKLNMKQGIRLNHDSERDEIRHKRLFNPQKHISSRSLKATKYNNLKTSNDPKSRLLSNFQNSLFKINLKKKYELQKSKSLIKLNKISFLDISDQKLVKQSSFYKLKNQFPKRPQLLNMKRHLKKLHSQGLYTRRLYTSIS